MLHLFFNIMLLFFIINLNWFADKFKKRPTDKSMAELITVPVLLGIVLTIVDNLRVFFIYRLLIIIILALLVYLAVGKYKKYFGGK